jgi:hypothetical protein
MPKPAAAVDDRQGMIPIDLPPGPRLSSDERARDDLLTMIDTLAAAKTNPWSERLLGWQLRRLEALRQLLTPIEAAAITARFELELERLGPPSAME